MKQVILMFFLFLASLTYAQQSFTLEEAVEYGIRESASKKLDAIEVRNADLEVKEYKSIGLPTIQGKVDYNYFIDLPISYVPAEFFGGQPGEFAELAFGTDQKLTAGVSLNQLIFDGSFFTGLKAQKLYRELVSKNVDQTNYEIRNEVTKAYMAVTLADENIEMLEKNIANLDESIEETTALFDNGFAEKLDIDRLHLSVDQLNSTKMNLERIRILNLNLLKFQMSYPLDQDLTLSQSLDDIVDKIITQEVDINQIDYSKRPEYTNIILGQQLNELNLKAQKNARYPSLFGFASHDRLLQRNEIFNSDEPGFSSTTVAGLSLNVPIYSGGSKNISIQKVKLDIEETEIQKSEFERSLDMQIKNLYELFVNAKNNVFIAKRREALANDIYDVTKIKYAEGVGSSLERSQAERDVYSAQQNYMQALYDMVTAKIELDIAKGELQDLKY